jgi:hypothetical protein
MPTVSLLPGETQWRSRKVRYYAGDWDSIQTVMPQFDLVPFTAGKNEPDNPFLLTVMRRPLSAAERPIPVGVVSHTYSLVSHGEIAALCRQGIIDAGIDGNTLSYEVGLSELGEWMNFRIYLGKTYSFTDTSGKQVDLRLECFNSVDGSSRLMIVFGWLRFVCANGLIIGETKIEINERHNRTLDLALVSERIGPALKAVEADRRSMDQSQTQYVAIDEIRKWADDKLTEEWGKKAAARVFHICDSGKDVEIGDPFATGSATQKPIRYLERVPGSPERAETKFDVLQALSFIATRRNNSEERIAWQAGIPRLLQHLPLRTLQQ